MESVAVYAAGRRAVAAHPLARPRRREIGERGGDPVARLPRHRGADRGGQGERLRLRPSRATASSPRTPPSPSAARAEGLTLHRPVARRPGAVRRQGRRRARLAAVAGHPGRARQRRRRSPRADEAAAAAARDRLSGDAQGGGRRRRARHARRRRAPTRWPRRSRAASSEAQAAFGDGAVFLEKLVAAAAPHRGADPGRRPGQRRPPLRARLLGAAAQPEGGRDRARRPASTPALRQRILADAVTPRARRRLRQRRHRRVPGRSPRPASTSSSSATRASRSSTPSPSR